MHMYKIDLTLLTEYCSDMQELVNRAHKKNTSLYVQVQYYIREDYLFSFILACLVTLLYDNL